MNKNPPLNQRYICPIGADGIQRWHLREGVSIREIARRTKLSRNTIRKYLTNGELEPK